jgi:transcriptional regulator NrdR family protein
MRSRSHTKATVDGRYRCVHCGQLFSTLEAADAHHFRVHQKQPQISYAGVY